MSQQELGHYAGLHRTEVGMVERGIRCPRIDTVNRLAGSLGVEPGELLKSLPRYEPPPPPAEGELLDDYEDRLDADLDLDDDRR